MKLREFIAAVFPFRAHLEAEIDYLKAQLAQERRRSDELRQALVEVKMPKLVLRDVPRPTANPKPQGWEAFRKVHKDVTEEAQAGNVPGNAQQGA